MITVTPIQEKSEQEALCARCGIPYRAEMLAYHAQNDGVFAGVCQFRLDATGGHIQDLANPMGRSDPETLFVMGRAALNFIDLCGVHTATFDGTADPALLRRIGFLEKDGCFTIDLAGFFSHPCEHTAN